MQKKIIPLAVIVMAQLITSCAKNSPQNPSPSVTSRVPTSEAKEESPWTTWYKRGTVGGLLVLKGIRENLMHNNLHDPHVDYSSHKAIDCSKINTKVRSADGSCNNIEKPHTGAAGVAFGRNIAPEFIDHDAKEKLMVPNPIEISKELFTRDEFKPVPFLNMIAASWIQFMNHDWMTHGINETKRPHQIENKEGDVVRTLDRTKVNPNNPDQYKSSFGKVTTNDVTHWWDGSQIYGSSQDEQNQLRSFANGKMTTVKVNGKELLPKVANFNPHHNRQNHGVEATGFRENWWVGLSMLHTLFVKEHNAIAEELMKKNVKFNEKTQKYDWRNGKERKSFDAKELDEHVFQIARLINSAVMAKIHTVEWTPAILPNNVLKKGMYTNWYGLAHPQTWSKLIKNIPGFDKANLLNGVNLGYTLGGIVGDKTNDYGVPFSITEEFVSVYRLHSLLPETLEIRSLKNKNAVKAYAFTETRNEKAYEMMATMDQKDLFYSLGTQMPGQLVLNNFPKFMQELSIPGHGTMDLAMVDVMRDRERGVPRYNQFRRAISLKPIKSYKDFFPNDKPLDERQLKIIEKLTKIYGKDDNGKDNVEMIDLLVGTSAEEVRPSGFGFGETQFHIFILMASRRLMADRFFTEDYNKDVYTKTGMNWIDNEGWMRKVILRHMPELQPQLKGLETPFLPWNK